MNFVRIRALVSGELRDEDPIRRFFPSGFIKVGDEVEVAEEDAYLFSPDLFERVEQEKKEEEPSVWAWNEKIVEEEEVED